MSIHPTEERHARVLALLKTSKHQLVLAVRTFWVDGVTPPEKWTKEELAGSVADMEISREKSAAYGDAPRHNGYPMEGSRPRCGGADCEGHALPARPWQEVRDRHRAGYPCIGPMPEPTGPTQARLSFLRNCYTPQYETPSTAMRFTQGDTHDGYRWRRPDLTVDETRWWTCPQDDARFAYEIPGDAVQVLP